jgi:signal transduction histidine kinase
MRYAFLSTIAAALLLLLVLMGLLERTVLAPIAKLTDHALAVGKTDDTYARLASDRPDEIGILSREFDDMLEKLGKSRQAVVETARAAGMSEIATGVLHNVGNVLNSVNVSATMVAQKVRATALGDLERVVEVMDQHAADLPGFLGKDPRGKHLHPFLKSLTAKLAEERAALEREVHGLTEGIDHVKVLVKAQQTYARRTEVLEPTILAEQIEAALGISYQVLPKREDLVVERELEDLPRVNVDRHKLMEILVNVIINARQSMAESGCAPPILRLSVAKVDDERVQIRIADNGLGIPPENLVNIFKHGFTTKKNGHGFGLHTAANAATEMSGGLRAESDGPGKGATFVLEIPFRTARELAKAS